MLEYLDSLVDESDPDTEASQTQHALQTAEAIRAKYPGEEYEWSDNAKQSKAMQ